MDKQQQPARAPAVPTSSVKPAPPPPKVVRTSDRAAQLRTLATSFYREMMRLADEMDAGTKDDTDAFRHPDCLCGPWVRRSDPVAYARKRHPKCPVHPAPAMDPALDC